MIIFLDVFAWCLKKKKNFGLMDRYINNYAVTPEKLSQELLSTFSSPASALNSFITIHNIVVRFFCENKKNLKVHAGLTVPVPCTEETGKIKNKKFVKESQSRTLCFKSGKNLRLRYENEERILDRGTAEHYIVGNGIVFCFEMTQDGFHYSAEESAHSEAFRGSQKSQF